MGTLWRDIRYSLRTLAKSPGFAIVAILILGLGIGAATSVFSIANGVLLRALPYKNPDRLAMLFSSYPAWGEERSITSGMNFLDWQAQSESFEGMAVVRREETTYRHEDGTDHIEGLCVSPSLFALLGWEALAGRTLRPEESWPDHHYIVLGYDFWQRHLGGDEAVLGKGIVLGGHEQAYTVVGIMPSGVRFLETQADKFVDFWIPVGRDLPEIAMGGRGCLRWNVVGRLRPGISIRQAQAEMDGIAERIAKTEFTDPTHAPGVNVIPLHAYVVGDTRALILLAGGAAGFVLLIACANVVTLLLARGLARRREIATRAALGAGRARLLRQMMTESVLLSLMGGTLGILLAYGGVQVFRAIVPSDLARLEEIGVDPGTLAFALGIVLLSGLIIGLIPALRTCRIDVNEALKADTRGATLEFGRRRVASLFVASEVSLSLILLIGSGLLINSLSRLLLLDPGYRTENILTLKLENLRGDRPRELLERAKALPGVRSAALVSGLPLCSVAGGSNIVPEGRQGSEIARHMVTARLISPGYFHAIGIPLLAGRDFTEKDNRDAPRVTVINESLARRFWSGQDPIGKRFEFGWAGATVEIVGVVRDTRSAALDADPILEAFLPLQQKGRSRFSLVVATESDPANLVSALRQEIRSVDVNAVIREVRTMADIVATTLATRRFLVVVLSAFSVVAVVLASFGLYGVIAHSVRQRTPEIGIRMALGATRGDVLTAVLGEGCKLTAVGVVVGLIGALALTRTVAIFLYDVSPTDPVTFASTSLLLIGIALLACYIPARRAAKIDPMAALRYE
jgi:putative ABC transport system permease protein